jgi:TolA-binding protein
LRLQFASVEALREQYKEAEEQFRETVRRCPDPHARYWLGRMLVAQGRLEESVPELQAVLAALPGHVEARELLGTVQHRLGRLDEAIRLYEDTLKLTPNAPDTERAHRQARDQLRKKG